MKNKTLVTKKHEVSPFKAGLKCELLREGNYKEIHMGVTGEETELYYDIEVMMPSGYKTFARREWFEEE